MAKKAINEMIVFTCGAKLKILFDFTKNVIDQRVRSWWQYVK